MPEEAQNQDVGMVTSLDIPIAPVSTVTGEDGEAYEVVDLGTVAPEAAGEPEEEAAPAAPPAEPAPPPPAMTPRTRDEYFDQIRSGYKADSQDPEQLAKERDGVASRAARALAARDRERAEMAQIRQQQARDQARGDQMAQVLAELQERKRAEEAAEQQIAAAASAPDAELEPEKFQDWQAEQRLQRHLGPIQQQLNQFGAWQAQQAQQAQIRDQVTQAANAMAQQDQQAEAAIPEYAAARDFWLAKAEEARQLRGQPAMNDADKFRAWLEVHQQAGQTGVAPAQYVMQIARYLGHAGNGEPPAEDEVPPAAAPAAVSPAVAAQRRNLARAPAPAPRGNGTQVARSPEIQDWRSLSDEEFNKRMKQLMSSKGLDEDQALIALQGKTLTDMPDR